jgi:hypothetical protein
VAAREQKLTEEVVRQTLPRPEDVDEVKQALFSLGSQNIIDSVQIGNVVGRDHYEIVYKFIINLAQASGPLQQAGTIPVRAVVHKGLLSYEETDKDYFLMLVSEHPEAMPDGLPDSIRFWKYRIESLDPDKSFQVGYIWGPSGCGKSSLVKAGLLM